MAPRSPLPGKKRHKFALKSKHGQARVFDEYHALVVQVAKHHCKKKMAECDGCPLQPYLPGRDPQKAKPGT